VEPGATGPSRSASATTAASPSSSSSSRRRPPVTDTWRCRARHVHRDGAGARRQGPHGVPTEVERECCVVDVALRWGTGYDTEVRSFVNIIATPKGGTHQLGFEQALLKTFRAEVEKNARRLKVGDDKLEKDDVLEGLTAVVTVRLAEPQFEGQTKEVLGTPRSGRSSRGSSSAELRSSSPPPQAGRQGAGGSCSRRSSAPR
jgi:DNA gyrase subunit B